MTIQPSGIDSLKGDFPSDDARPLYEELAEIWGVREVSPLSADEIELLRSSHKSGNTDDFEALLDDTTTEFLATRNPQFAQNIRAMRATQNPELQGEIRDRQLALYDQAKAIILETAGISEDASKSDLDRAREAITVRLQSAYERDGDHYDPLATLKILQEDEDGQEVFTYPNGLFPKETDDRWSAYIDAVKRHVQVSNKLANGLAAQGDVVQADYERRMAHNALARDLQHMLGKPGDDFEEYRKLAAKMREQRFPSVETSEKSRTNLMIGTSAIEAMHSHLLPHDAVYGGVDW